ncbi:YchJ family metal-binding protein [Micromonospora sp. WMMD1102]|uniref:YchJ family protein n=1 Tax=Micromonospora sp. WMMD1102 TaxID=3016105 RepID=UPI0024157B09|nr:YchJ family metal-binding protein [Micromonospora sp. WMMD1102]MDG4788169.1 YchJ family metal-binding protein [Micromonospora sp. WMMD1102]
MAQRRARRAGGHGSTRPCPCGLGPAYEECCGALHQGRTVAATAEALMRSRFSAFALGDSGYLLRTWHSSTRPERLVLDPANRWTRLDVLDSERGGMFDSTGTVEFRAHYRRSGRPGELHERSRFGREDGQWRYLGAE